MIVRCAQCGAKIDRTEEGRFFSCPFCASSLVLEGKVAFSCFFMEHTRHDIFVRALFRKRLAEAGIRYDGKSIDIHFAYHPFWMAHRADGTSVLRPAAHEQVVALANVKIPPGRLSFYDETNFPHGEVVSMAIPAEEAFGQDTGVVWNTDRIDLVYFPVYCLRYIKGLSVYDAALVGDSTRFYSDSLSEPRGTLPLRPLLFFIASLAVFTGIGFYFNGVVMKAIGIGLAALVAFIISTLAVGKWKGTP
jgi:hypothetical protein